MITKTTPHFYPAFPVQSLFKVANNIMKIIQSDKTIIIAKNKLANKTMKINHKLKTG